MIDTIDVQGVTISKNPCATNDVIKISAKVVFVEPIKDDEPQRLPYTLSHGLGEGEFD